MHRRRRRRRRRRRACTAASKPSSGSVQVGRGRGLAHRLLGVGVHALALDEPGAGEGLPQQVGERRRRAAARAVISRARQLGPLVGQLAEHGQPGPDVLAALGVVRRQRGHALRRRVCCRSPLGARGTSSGSTPKCARVAADLVQRDEAGVAVERGVLDALGHHRAGGLLEAHAQLVGRVGQPRRRARRSRRRDRAGRPARRSIAAARSVGAGRQVGAVDREGDEQLGQRLGGLVDRRAPAGPAGRPRPAGSSRRRRACRPRTCSAQLRLVAGELAVERGRAAPRPPGRRRRRATSVSAS